MNISKRKLAIKARELPELYTPEQAAAKLKVAVATLVNWRINGSGPRYIKIVRRIRYPADELALYMAAKTQTSTSENHRPKKRRALP